MALLAIVGLTAIVLMTHKGAPKNSAGVEVNANVHHEEAQAPAQPPDRPLDRRFKTTQEANFAPGGYGHAIRDMKYGSWYKGTKVNRYEPPDVGKWNGDTQAYVQRSVQ